MGWRGESGAFAVRGGVPRALPGTMVRNVNTWACARSAFGCWLRTAGVGHFR